jgi:hypothetical protein
VSTLPKAPPAAEPAIFGAAPPGAALVLAAFNIASAAWLLACIGVYLGRPAADHASRNTAALDSDSWTGWTGPFRGLIEFTLGVGIPLVFFLLLISVASLGHGTVRSEPRIFRVLLGATIALALVPVALCTLGGLASGG